MSHLPDQPESGAMVDLGFAKVDLQRQERCGLPEVIFGLGKTAEQVISIARALRDNGQPVLATRIVEKDAIQITAAFPEARYDPTCEILTIEKLAVLPGRLAVAAAGTSDLKVAEEVALTAEFFGVTVDRFTDVGVAGIHRLFHRLEDLRSADVIVAVAGMEGALPSVIGGLVDRPVIAVPTSIGYGANLQGMTALCGMLTSCSSGVTVVNIDNGFGGAYAAIQILRLLQNNSTDSSQP